MKSSTVLKWISGGLEAFWGFPIIGGTFVIGLAYTPLMLMFILHIITLIFSLIQDKKVHGSILGIITSVIAWIPILGMLMHILTAVFLMIDAYQTQKRDTMIID